MSETVTIGRRTIGAGEPVLVIAEVGVNHDGDVATAMALVDAAADAGAEAVKFQTFDSSALATPGADLAAYQRERGTEAASQREMLARLELGADEFARIAAHCRERGVLFLSTPFDLGSAALLAELGVPAFKVGSGELTNLPFLRTLSDYGLPLLVSTGMATLDEVGAAVETVGQGTAPLVLLHCVSSYPAPAGEANLRAISTLRRAFGVPVGYSDHCMGAEVTLAAVALDACVIERHLTLDRDRPGPDHAMSMEPDELAQLISRIREVEASLGTGQKEPQPSELETRVVARRSLVAARSLPAGATLTADALAIKRPGDGLAPDRLQEIIGRRLRRALDVDEQLREADLEPQP
jgi:N,N'-diacetyllegionaminate synthase